MSTNFAIFQYRPRLDGHGCLTEEDYLIPHVKCFHRGDFYCCWTNSFEVIVNSLDDSVYIYPIDNTPQGIYTIGDLKKLINEQEKREGKFKKREKNK